MFAVDLNVPEAMAIAGHSTANQFFGHVRLSQSKMKSTLAEKKMALHSPVNPKDFWERKIIDWEIGRYGLSEKNEQSFFEKIADKSSNSLRQRLQLASQYLAPFVDGKRVLEVGCGSGL